MTRASGICQQVNAERVKDLVELNIKISFLGVVVFGVRLVLNEEVLSF
jgi:hypothetical protein